MSGHLRGRAQDSGATPGGRARGPPREEQGATGLSPRSQSLTERHACGPLAADCLSVSTETSAGSPEAAVWEGGRSHPRLAWGRPAASPGPPSCGSSGHMSPKRNSQAGPGAPPTGPRAHRRLVPSRKASVPTPLPSTRRHRNFPTELCGNVLSASYTANLAPPPLNASQKILREDRFPHFWSVFKSLPAHGLRSTARGSGSRGSWFQKQSPAHCLVAAASALPALPRQAVPPSPGWARG